MKVIVLNAGKCAWGKCLFCGWGRENKEVSADELIEKFEREKSDEVKLFCSGSLLDDKQFPIKFQKHLVKAMQGKILYIESRPEFVTPEKLELFKGVKLVIALGLEAASNEVLKKLRKGITLEQVINASRLIHEHDFKVKLYILVNHPYDSKELLKESVKFAREHADEYVLINTYPHVMSGLYDLWINGEWKPLSEKEFNELVKEYTDAQLESNNYAFTPKFREKADLKGVGIEYITHPHFEVWQDYINRLYTKPENKTIALFLPCSKKKPYYNSQTHIAIRRVIAGYDWYKNTHLIVISNPGIIPVEFADKYPFTDYDWDERLETPELMKEYIKINTKRAINYLKNHHYDKVFSFFKPESESGIALENACKELKINLIKLCDTELYKKIGRIIHPLMINEFKKKIVAYNKEN